MLFYTSTAESETIYSKMINIVMPEKWGREIEYCNISRESSTNLYRKYYILAKNSTG